jgi:PAS domain S-box-containing protein
MYEANFRLVMESAPDGVVIVDAEGRIILLNAAAEALFGYARDELLGQNLETLIRHPGFPAGLFRWPGAPPAGTRRNLTALRKDGSARPVEVRLTALRMPTGAATMATIIDMSEREKVEQELRRSEARFRAIAENFPGVIFQRVTWPDGRLEYPYVSPSLERVFALPVEALLGVRTQKDLEQYIFFDDHKTVMAKLQGAAARPAPVELEGRIKGSDGQVRWLRSISRPTSPGPDGSVLWDGVMLDVTEHRRAQQQLEERTRDLETAKRKLEALVSSTSEIVWTVNPDGIAEEDSPSRRAFTGETLEEWLSGGCYDVIHPDDREETSRRWAEARQSGVGFTNEYRLRHVSGEWRWMRVDRVPLRDAQGVLTGWVGMSKDITEERKAKEQLQLVNSELSHRIKNLLSIIIAIAQETGKRAGRMQDYLADFRSRLEGLARSHDVLVKGSWEAVYLDELVRSHLDSFVDGSYPGRISASGPPLRIKAEVAQTLGMALHELATNAVKYGALSNPVGRVEVQWSLGRENGSEGQFALRWTETGGPAVSDPPSAGYGSIVITTLAERAIRGKARLEFKKTGVEWSLNAPANSVADGS